MFLWRIKTVDVRDREASIAAGVSALVAMQRRDGSFPLLHWGKRSWARECFPLFSTIAVILAAGALLPQNALARAVEFVLQCRRPDGLWDFDPKLGLPPDSDCTACALAIIARHGSEAPDASEVTCLRSFWRHPNGPFTTWAADGEWGERERDDAVVNCNILFALTALGARPSARERSAVASLVGQSTAGCRYYCSASTIAYSAVRAGLAAQDLPSSLTTRPSLGGVLPMAQWLSTTASPDGDAVDFILSRQAADGRWRREEWLGRPGHGRWGSDAVSTALCIEGLIAAGIGDAR
jgi:hypothetical protein